MTDRIILKSVGELLGHSFFIPHYQRGYRWTDQQVKDLLNDIDTFSPKSIPGTDEKTFYCLQPIVVKDCKDEIKAKHNLSGKWYELIDGQQRLTTIFLLIHYANEMWIGKQKNTELTIRYETRDKSATFLQNLKINDTTGKAEIDKSNIDFYHISKAYDVIHEWVVNYKAINKKDLDNNEFQSKLKSYAKVIWYEVEDKSNSIELFTRLNVGKIPLTNAELVKALFLSSNSYKNESAEGILRKNIEISLLWDEIEQKLNEEDGLFWAFVTNNKRENYATKIELIFDLISHKKPNEIDPLFTFLYFLKESKDSSKSLWNLWLSIEQYYLTLIQWHKDKNIYHKVGFLIAIGENLCDLIDLSMEISKDKFEKELNTKIADSVNYDLDDLSYENASDYKKIERVLLLFNVESIRNNDYVSEFYPFKFHKSVNWSLEHIHAQNSESLDRNKKEQWIEWLNYHEKLIIELWENESNQIKKSAWKDLLDKRKELKDDTITWDSFNLLSKEIIEAFSSDTNDTSNDLHSISNLALLSQPDNSALNNAVFEVKRREIISMDKTGCYIPICTRRVFLKYYNDKPSTQQYYFWGKEDRENYLKEIKLVVEQYFV